MNIKAQLDDILADLPLINSSTMKSTGKLSIDDIEGLRDFVAKGNTDPKKIGIPAVKLKQVDIAQIRQGKVPMVREVDVLRDSTAKSKDFYRIIDDLVAGNNVFLVGEAGTGKTYTANEVAKALGRKTLTINCNQWTSPREIIGGDTIQGYKDGKLAVAWELGMILIIDEMPKLDSNTAGILNEALAKSDKEGEDSALTLPDGRIIQKHPNFGCIATGNTTGKSISAKYGGNNKQDASLIDRFSSCYYFINFDRDLEINNVFTKVFEICDKMRSVLINEEAEDIITLRTMLQMNRIFNVEMQRLLGNIEKNDDGKTLKDSILSYLAVLDDDMREILTDNINFDKFYSTYKDVQVYLKDLEEFATGVVRIPPPTK